MKRYRITIAEPWNFISPTGDNIILGVIEKIVTPKILIFQSDDLLDFGEKKTSKLILSPRFKESIFSEEIVNIKISVNGGVLENTMDLTEESLRKNGQFLLIGTLEMI